MRQINLIVVHCSATPEGRDVTAADINKMHIARGFKKIGYHYVVRLDGTVEKGRNENEIGAHVKGYNANSIGVCYVGGVASDSKTPKDTRTPAQKSALKKLLHTLKQRYPNARIVGHRDLSHDLNHDGKIEPSEWVKACPCFNAEEEYIDIK